MTHDWQDWRDEDDEDDLEVPTGIRNAIPFSLVVWAIIIVLLLTVWVVT